MSHSADFGPTADDYAAFRAGFPPACFSRLKALGIGLPGQRIVDLGTGTGTLARGLANAGARVIGIDPKPEMLAAARRLAADEGLDINFDRDPPSKPAWQPLRSMRSLPASAGIGSTARPPSPRLRAC